MAGGAECQYEALPVSDADAAAPPPVELSWHGVEYSVPLPKAAQADAAPGDADAVRGARNENTGGAEPRRRILSAVAGRVRAPRPGAGGELVAIMGPSGGGKTSLLNVLAGRVPVTKGAALSGSVRVNGAEARDMADISAYVMQDDALFALSTVEETLHFAARLRLHRWSPEARAARVDEVIRELGLSEARHTVVGSERLRGLSGGERRRLQLGVELLHRPSIIFADEPTSGLDSFQAASVMDTLWQRSRAGHTVIASIHQPRSQIWAMFDQVVLLSGGAVVYSGEAQACAAHFSQYDAAVPAAFNPADWFLDRICVDRRSASAEEASTRRVRQLIADFRGRDAEEEGAAGLGGRTWSQLDAIVPADDPGFTVPFSLLVRRSWREQTRDKGALMLKYAMNLFFAVMFGLVYLRMDTTQQSLQDRTGILFFQAMNQAFGSSISTSQVIPMQLKIVSRERASKMYSVVPYYAATFIVALPLELIPQMAYGAIIYFMANLRPGGGAFFTFVGILALENFTAIGLGMVLSASLPSVELAPQLAPAVVVLFLMFSGYFLNEESIPKWLIWMKYISFIRYAFQALCVNEFRGRDDFAPDVLNNVTLRNDTGDTYLENYLKFGSVEIWKNCVYMGAELVVLNVLAFTVLMLKRPKFLRLLRPGAE